MQAPIRPEPKPATLDPSSSAVAVLDLTVQCDDPSEICSQLIPGVSAFLERARAKGVPAIFTGVAFLKGTPQGEAAMGLRRQSTEPLIYPDGYDKFMSGELRRFLDERNVKTLVIVGSSTHLAVMYTATTAARMHDYTVVIPLDGVNTRNSYEHEYSLHQLSVLPRGVSQRFLFTTLSMIEWA